MYPCGGYQALGASQRQHIVFSIHIPAWGVTRGGYQLPAKTENFNPPRVGGDALTEEIGILKAEFQSTPPVWGATLRPHGMHRHPAISIHTPRVGGDDLLSHPLDVGRGISIHTPRVGGDYLLQVKAPEYKAFQSTPPVWGATSA